MNLYGLALSERKLSWTSTDPKQRQPLLFNPEHPVNCAGSPSAAILEEISSLAGSRVLRGDRYELASGATPLLFQPDLKQFESKPLATIDVFGQTPWIFEENQGADPTIACARAELLIPELQDENIQKYFDLKPEEDLHFFTSGSRHLIAATEVGIQQVWSIPHVVERINEELETSISSDDLKQSIFRRFQNSLLMHPDVQVWIPPFSATFILIIGDHGSLNDADKPVVVRTHDCCTPSDVSGSQWCSCRPNLVPFYVNAIKAARRGGCGILVYSTYTEGRGFDLPRKLSVYNHREAVGREDPDHYFSASEQICGVGDGRLQYLHPPDVLRYLGVTDISILHSENPRKIRGIKAAGIKVRKTQGIDQSLVSKQSRLAELEAKKRHAGYAQDHSDD